MNAIDRTLRALEAHPEARSVLNAGASEADLDALRLAFPDVPEGLVAFLRLHDGTRINGPRIAGRGLFTAAGIVSDAAHWNELAKGFEASGKPAHGALWRAGWIPFAYNDESVLALATLPCFGGPAGQVIDVDFKTGLGWSVCFASFDEWLEALANTASATKVGIDDAALPSSASAFYADLLTLVPGVSSDDTRIPPLDPGALNERFAFDFRTLARRNAVLDAVRTDNATKLRALLSSGFELSQTLLHVYAAHPRPDQLGKPPRDAEVANVLLDAGIDVNAEDTHGDTALHLAIAAQNLTLARVLLKRGANANLVNARGYCAVDNLQLERLNPEPLTGRWKTAPVPAFDPNRWPDAYDTIEALLQHGADPNGGPKLAGALFDAETWRFVELLAAHGKTHLIDFVLQAGASLPSHPRALALACAHEHAETFDLLLEKGADPNAALGVALEKGERFLAKLLDHKADPNARVSGEPALIHAVRAGKHRHVALLLKKGADPLAQGTNGKSAYELAEAAYRSGVNDARVILSLLRDAGASSKPAPSAAPIPTGPQPGVRVTHAKFGAGVITKVDKDMLDVTFDSGEKKSLLVRFVTLR